MYVFEEIKDREPVVGRPEENRVVFGYSAPNPSIGHPRSVFTIVPSLLYP